MALTNTQYESIMRGYEKRQTQNHHLWRERRDEIHLHIPAFLQLDESISSLSVAQARQLLQLEGQAAVNATADYRAKMAVLSQEKRKLLIDFGYPETYLDPIFTCQDCEDSGYIHDTTSSTGSTKCHCFKQQEISLLYQQSNIQEVIEQENFSTLSFSYYQNDEDLLRFQNAVKVSKEFVHDFKEQYQNLFFYGTVGCGKSFLSGCIAKELMQQGYPVIYFSALGLFEILARYSFDIKAKETLYNFYKDLYNCDLVIIDDLGTEVTNSFVTSQLFACLNERHLSRKATIISTNLSLEELRDRYSDRVFSRITSNFQICKLSGPDIRMYKKRMANRK